ncbi:MAG: 30S ribosomal protein S4 [Chloroflexi bacterium]|nr:30S ribosomal protein S4 [Chloroflexota bacterium]
MARYTGPVCRICRRYGEKLMLKGDKCVTKCTLDKRPQPPGAIATRRRKLSDRALQLREKQKARYSYGVLEKQFRDYYDEAVRLPGVTGENLVRLLEMRLDNVVHKMGFADSLKAARQVVRHGHIMLNGRKTDVPSAATRAGDVIGWTAGSKKSEQYQYAKANMSSKQSPAWLNVDSEQMTGRIVSPPAIDMTPSKFDPAVIVEYYSR